MALGERGPQGKNLMNSHTTLGGTEGLGGVYSQVFRSYYHFKRVRSGQQGAESEQRAGRVGLLGTRFGGTLGGGGVSGARCSAGSCHFCPLATCTEQTRKPAPGLPLTEHLNKQTIPLLT